MGSFPWEFFWGIVIGTVVNFITGISVITWHFKKQYWIVNPETVDDYPFKLRID